MCIDNRLTYVCTYLPLKSHMLTAVAIKMENDV